MIEFIAGVLSGIAGAMGLGGGTVLLIFLLLIMDLPQLQAQGINLIFFLPCAAVAMIFHFKNKLIKTGTLPAIITGLLGAAAGTFLSGAMNETLLQKIFGGLLIFLGAKELFSRIKKRQSPENKELPKNIKP